MPTFPFKRDGHAWSSGEVITAALLNGLPQGRLAEDFLASNITGFHAATVIVKCNSVDVPDSREIRVSVDGQIGLLPACYVTARLYWSGSELRTWHLSNNTSDIPKDESCVFSDTIFPGAPDTTSTWLTLETNGPNIDALAGFRMIVEDIGSATNLIAT